MRNKIILSESLNKLLTLLFPRGGVLGRDVVTYGSGIAGLSYVTEKKRRRRTVYTFTVRPPDSHRVLAFLAVCRCCSFPEVHLDKPWTGFDPLLREVGIYIIGCDLCPFFLGSFT